jgi:hypothetical protein
MYQKVKFKLGKKSKGDCNIPEFWMIYHVWIFAKNLKLFVWTCVLPNLIPIC